MIYVTQTYTYCSKCCGNTVHDAIGCVVCRNKAQLINVKSAKNIFAKGKTK